MGSLSVWHYLILIAIVVILFGGGGRLSRIMGDFGKGISSFRSGIRNMESERRGEASFASVASDAPIVESGLRGQESMRR